MFSLTEFKKHLASSTLAVVLGVAGLSFSGGEAGAATYTSDNSCLLTDVTGGGVNANDCFGAEEGNPSQIGSAEFEGGTFIGYFSDNSKSTVGLFGKTDWNEVAKWDSTSSNNLNMGTVPSSSGTPSTWEVLNNALHGYDYIAVMLKQGNKSPNGFAAYLFEPVQTSGTWFTSWAKDSGNISNLTIWAGNGDGCVPTPANDFCDQGPPVTDVPVPAGLPLILTALAAVGVIARSKRA